MSFLSLFFSCFSLSTKKLIYVIHTILGKTRRHKKSKEGRVCLKANFQKIFSGGLVSPPEPPWRPQPPAGPPAPPEAEAQFFLFFFYKSKTIFPPQDPRGSTMIWKNDELGKSIIGWPRSKLRGRIHGRTQEFRTIELRGRIASIFGRAFLEGSRFWTEVTRSRSFLSGFSCDLQGMTLVKGARLGPKKYFFQSKIEKENFFLGVQGVDRYIHIT